jgi:insertion element IS1 protein InsB
MTGGAAAAGVVIPMSGWPDESVLRLPPRAYAPRGGQLNALTVRASCPQCQSPKDKTNGHIHHGKPNAQGQDCGRPFVECFAHDLISADTRALVEYVLVGRISWRGLWRALGVTLKWLLGVRVEGVEALPAPLHVPPATCKPNVMIHRLAVEADGRASVVPKEVNKPWIWLAMDAMSRQVMAVRVGDGSPAVPSG